MELLADSSKKVRQLIAEAKSLKDIITNENCLILSMMMRDEEQCISRRSAYDSTNDLRQKLETCETYSTQLNLNETGNVTMQILGMQDGFCRYSYTIYNKAPSPEKMKMLFGEDDYQKMKDVFKDRTNSINCSFTDVSRKEYIKLLEKTSIPEGDAYDFDIMNQYGEAQKEAVSFLFDLDECEPSLP